MIHRYKNVAIILAGGKGERLNNSIPKQLIKIAGKKVLEHTLLVFQTHKLIDEIAIVVNDEIRREVEDILTSGLYSKVKKILIGGDERYKSSLAAIEAYDEETNLIFHDSVRPLVTHSIISNCIEALKDYDAVDVAIPTTDTIIRVNSNNEIVEIPSRATLRNGQTPQAFKLSTIKKAYKVALKDSNFQTTDDCGVVVKYIPNVKVCVVKGELYNMKLTYKEDLFLIEKLFQFKSSSNLLNKSNLKIKNYQNKVIVVYGGSSGIGSEIVKILSEFGAKVYSFSRKNGVDISNPNNVIDSLRQVYMIEGKINHVVNTAAILEKQPIINQLDTQIVENVNVNYTGAIFIAKYSFKYLKKTKGSLLLFTSSSYTRGRALYSLYSSSKAAIVNLVQALGEEWASHNVRINCINPERCKTPMRTKNFGIEDPNKLLDPKIVAIVSLNTLIAKLSGEVIDVKK